MTCRELLDFLDDYIEGQLPWKVRVAFLLHLQLCPACRDYLDSYRKTIVASRTAMSALPLQKSEQLPEELIKAIRAARGVSGTNDDEGLHELPKLDH